MTQRRHDERIERDPRIIAPGRNGRHGQIGPFLVGATIPRFGREQGVPDETRWSGPGLAGPSHGVVPGHEGAAVVLAHGFPALAAPEPGLHGAWEEGREVGVEVDDVGVDGGEKFDRDAVEVFEFGRVALQAFAEHDAVHDAVGVPVVVHVPAPGRHQVVGEHLYALGFLPLAVPLQRRPVEQVVHHAAALDPVGRAPDDAPFAPADEVAGDGHGRTLVRDGAAFVDQFVDDAGRVEEDPRFGTEG